MSYRDPDATLEAEVGVKQSVVDARRRALGPLRRAVLSPDALAVIDALAAAVETADLAGKGARLDDLAARLDHALDASTRLLAAFGSEEIPEPAPPSLLGAALSTSSPVDVSEEVRRAAGTATDEWGSRATSAAFMRGDLAMFVTAAGALRDGATEITGSLATAMPLALPPLEAQLRTVASSFAIGLGLLADVETRDPAFDAAFRVRGAPDVARTLLDPDIRAALLALAPRRISLRIADGRARLAWTVVLGAHADAIVPEAAVSILSRLRRAIQT